MTEHKFEVGDAVATPYGIGELRAVDVVKRGGGVERVQYLVLYACGTRIIHVYADLKLVNRQERAVKPQLGAVIDAEFPEVGEDAACASCDKLNRELENLKRSTGAQIADMRGEEVVLCKSLDDKQVTIMWLEKELEREKAKNRKRGL